MNVTEDRKLGVRHLALLHGIRHRGFWRALGEQHGVTVALGAVQVGPLRVFIEPRDAWVGWYRADYAHFICPLPCVVLRIERKIPS